MKKSVIALGLVACAALSGEVVAKPVTVSFSGKQFSVNNAEFEKQTVSDTEFFTVTVDFEKCTLTSNGDVYKGVKCSPDDFYWSVSDFNGPIPFTYQTWVYAKPDGSFMYTFQGVNGWVTSVLRANSYKVSR